jgi:hypothetical protein
MQVGHWRHLHRSVLESHVLLFMYMGLLKHRILLTWCRPYVAVSQRLRHLMDTNGISVEELITIAKNSKRLLASSQWALQVRYTTRLKASRDAWPSTLVLSLGSRLCSLASICLNKKRITTKTVYHLTFAQLKQQRRMRHDPPRCIFKGQRSVGFSKHECITPDWETNRWRENWACHNRRST